MKFALGADPELFLRDAAGAYIASCGIIGGSKEAPMPLPIGPGFAVQEDNVAVEYNIPPSESKEQFTANISRAMSFLTDMVNAKGLAFADTSAVSFDLTQLTHPKAREFGCDPDFDAWADGKANPRPAATDKTLRTCGGHVHVGMKFKSMKERVRLIKFLDLFLGVPSVIMDDGLLRKSLYGKAGAFRFKPYGVEYRSLSNFWVVKPGLTDWVWDSVNDATDAWSANSMNIDDIGTDIQDAINNNNTKLATDLINAFNLRTVNA